MSITTRICISTNLSNAFRSSQSPNREWKKVSQKSPLEGRISIAGMNENRKPKIASTFHERPGTGSVQDPIGAPSERRKGGPQEEFIDVDPNFTKEMPEEEKKELLKRARKENKKEN